MDTTVLQSLADQLENALPQTQCTKCGYLGCRPYAEAMAIGEALHNQCPPGGQEGVARLSAILGTEELPLNPANGIERERSIALIDEKLCIGCTLCIQACPVDAIVGAPKKMHTVLTEDCTGCDLCLAPCPVDCITMHSTTPGMTGWQAWSQKQADQARQSYQRRQIRLVREQQENDARLAAKAIAKLAALNAEVTADALEREELARKKSIIEAAIERAKQKKQIADSQKKVLP